MLNTQNQHAIRDYINGQRQLEGLKLLALIRLIRVKGELIRTNDERLKGEKAYQYSSGEYICIKVSTYRGGAMRLQVFNMIQLCQPKPLTI